MLATEMGELVGRYEDLNAYRRVYYDSWLHIADSSLGTGRDGCGPWIAHPRHPKKRMFCTVNRQSASGDWLSDAEVREKVDRVFAHVKREQCYEMNSGRSKPLSPNNEKNDTPPEKNNATPPEEDADKAYDDGYDEGYADGFADGLEEPRQSCSVVGGHGSGTLYDVLTLHDGEVRARLWAYGDEEHPAAYADVAPESCSDTSGVFVIDPAAPDDWSVLVRVVNNCAETGWHSAHVAGATAREWLIDVTYNGERWRALGGGDRRRSWTDTQAIRCEP